MNNRQREIIEYLLSSDSFCTSKELAEHISVSMKTVQNEVFFLKNELKKNGADVESKTSKGYKLHVYAKEQFQCYLCRDKESSSNQEDNNDIALQLVQLFLYKRKILSIQYICDTVFVSDSTVRLELNKVKKIIGKYNLTLKNKRGQGYFIEGAEIDKRKCIIQEIVKTVKWLETFDYSLLSDISSRLVDILETYEYKVTDLIFQNLVMHIYIAMQRNISSFGIIFEEDKFTVEVDSAEMSISRAIFKSLCKSYAFEMSEYEISFFAMNLQGKRIYSEDVIINSEVDSLVLLILNDIKDSTMMDLTYDVDLHISLALHIIPMITRIRTNMQLKNPMITEIKINYMLAYELAVKASSIIQKKLNSTINEDEVACLALHFSLALHRNSYLGKTKKILVIMSSCRNESMLMKFKLMHRFNEIISEIEIVEELVLYKMDVSRYDVIFTTNKQLSVKNSNYIYINRFLKEIDLITIENALLGNAELATITKYFKESQFYNDENFKTKEDAIKWLCLNTTTNKLESKKLYESVMEREKFGSTAFVNHVAIPHPNSFICSETNITICVLKNAIEWGEFDVKYIIFINAGRNQSKDLQIIFDLISKLIMDDKNVKKIINDCSYENLINVLRNSLNS